MIFTSVSNFAFALNLLPKRYRMYPWSEEINSLRCFENLSGSQFTAIGRGYIVLKYDYQSIETRRRTHFASSVCLDTLFHSVEVYRAIERISGIRDWHRNREIAQNPKRTAFERSLHPSRCDDKTTIATQNLSGEASLRYGSVYPANPVIIRSPNTPHRIPQRWKIYLTGRIGHGMKKRER